MKKISNNNLHSVIFLRSLTKKQNGDFYMSENKIINQESSSTHPPTTPETWITPAETANATGLTLRTVINRAEKEKITAKVNGDIPFAVDGKQNYLTC